MGEGRGEEMLTIGKLRGALGEGRQSHGGRAAWMHEGREAGDRDSVEGGGVKRSMKEEMRWRVETGECGVWSVE